MAKDGSVHVTNNEKNDGGRRAEYAHVKFNVKDDGDRKAGSAHVNPGTSSDTSAL